MPFAPIRSPNLGVSLLKAALEGDEIPVTVHYFSIKMADEIGLANYDKINEKLIRYLIGEMLFSKILFRKSFDWETIISDLIKPSLKECIPDFSQIIQIIKDAEDHIPKFVENCLYDVIEKLPCLVGFSSSYQQNCASLLLAKKLKERVDLPIIIGGANCEGEMGYSLLKSFPMIDYVCSGDGDKAFIKFVKKLKDKQDPSTTRGILTRESTPLEVSLTDPMVDLDDLPTGNFEDFFWTVKKSSISRDLDLKMEIETSRGCWWGELSHCTFCGLNGSTMMYRSKTASVVLNEIKQILKRYKIRSFKFVDNILNPEYFNTLFPALIKLRLRPWIFFETKSNLSIEQLRIMKLAGVDAIQPGIESFSDIILEIMGKGSTGLQNIQLLKWTEQIGIRPYWNILVGFPGEPSQEYERMADLVTLLVHLPPPSYCTKIMLTRFSPYFSEGNKYGLQNIKPLKSYEYVYPFTGELLHSIAFFFDFDYSDHRNVDKYAFRLNKEVSVWKELWNRDNPPELTMTNAGEMIIIKDTRPCSVQKSYILSNNEKELYELCETIQRFGDLVLVMRKRHPDIKEEDIQTILRELCFKKLLITDNERYLALALRL
jgi:ribosomal peptide maturation radical SAM protein 1